MPGNEAGDRIHNFFAHENYPSGQHHVQSVDGNWSHLSNVSRIENQRQVGVHSNLNPKSYNCQQSDAERGHGTPSVRVPDGLNYMQLNVRPDFPIHQSQNQQQNLYNRMYGHQVFQKTQNEGNFLGLDAESEQHYLTPGVNLIHESQQGNAPGQNKKNSRLENSQSPVNFDLRGAQQQMNNPQMDMLQFPRQQSELGDMQLLQQQFLMKQMQDYQIQHAQHRYAAPQNSLNQMSAARQGASNLINGTPVHDASIYPCSPELMAGNSTWLPRGLSTPMQGSFSAPMFSPDPNKSHRLMGFVPQQADQSLYGVPVSMTRGISSQYSHGQSDFAMQQVAACSNSLPGHQFAALQNQDDIQDRTMVAQQGVQRKNSFNNAHMQGINGGIVVENSSQVNPHHRTIAPDFHGRHSIANSPDISQEKTIQPPQQSLPKLDPTEEKILYGTDINLWDAFGRTSSDTQSGTNCNAFPSPQCGPWSALLQSALAETSSGDLGLQEEWSNLCFQNGEPSTGNYQPVTFKDMGKQQTFQHKRDLKLVSSSGSRALAVHSDLNINHDSVAVDQKSKLSLLQELGTAHKSTQQSPKSGNWSDRIPMQKPLAESNNFYASSHLSDGDVNGKSMPSHCIPQQSIPLYNTGNKICNKLDAWKFTDSIPVSSDATLKPINNANSLHSFQSNHHQRSSHGKMGHEDSTWTADSISNTHFPASNLQVDRDDSNLSNVCKIPDSTASKTLQETSQLLPNNFNLDRWRQFDSSVKFKQNEELGEYHHHSNRSIQVVGSSAVKGDVEAREVEENCNKKENSSDSSCYDLSHHTSKVFKDNVQLIESDSHTLLSRKQKSSGHVGRGSVASRKFQYHPMGNLDMVAEPYGSQRIPDSPMMPQQVSQGLKNMEPGYFGQSQFLGSIPRNPMERERVNGQLPGFLGDKNRLDGLPFRGNVYMQNQSAPHDRSVPIYDPNKPAHSSDNMLDLLHKVDQSRESGNAAQVSNQSSDMPEAESSDGSAYQVQQNHSTSSQCFGLQLAPPSQRLPILNPAITSQSSPWTINSLSSSDPGITGPISLPSMDSSQSLPNREAFQGEHGSSRFATVREIPGKPSPSSGASGLSYAQNHFQNKHTMAGNGSDKYPNISFDGHESGFKQRESLHDRGQSSEVGQEALPGSFAGSIQQRIFPTEPSRTCSSQFDVGVPSHKNPVPDVPGATLQCSSSTMLPNTWSDSLLQQQMLGAHSGQISSNLFKPQFHADNNSNKKSSTKELNEECTAPSVSSAISDSTNKIVLGEKELEKERLWKQVPSERIGSSQITTKALQGKRYITHPSDASPSNSAGSQKDIEAFGRSLKPNSLNQNYSLLHEVQGMKCVESDPTCKDLERTKRPESSPDTQHSFKGMKQLSSVYDSRIRDPSADCTFVTQGDFKMLKELGDNQFRTPPSEDVPFARNDSQDLSRNHDTTSINAEHSHVNPHMATSWCEHPGTFRQMSEMCVAQKTSIVNTTEQQLIVPKFSDSFQVHQSKKLLCDAVDSRLANAIVECPASTSVRNEHMGPHPLPPDVSDQSLMVVRPKKRKSAIFECISWNKEIMIGSQRLHDLSMPEIDWAQAANRLMDKMEDRIDMIENGRPMFRPKQRLRLTSQLMQQIFRPPLPALLSADAVLNNESVVYMVARFALGDACGLASRGNINSLMTHAGLDLDADKLKSLEGSSSEQFFCKVMESLIGRSKKLENFLLGLEKRGSILDLRVECLELEKFSMINRFAKFHGNGQPDHCEVSSSSCERPHLQRYVTAVPAPQNLPDRVQCLSL